MSTDHESKDESNQRNLGGWRAEGVNPIVGVQGSESLSYVCFGVRVCSMELRFENEGCEGRLERERTKKMNERERKGDTKDRR